MLSLPQTTGYKVMASVLAVAGLLALALLYLVPVSDIDIWWHLATGRYLLQSGAFLTEDPFGLAGNRLTPGRELILNGYWLSQLLFYAVYQLSGQAGIVVSRVGLLLLPPVAALAYGWRRFPFSPAVLLLALLCGWAMVDVSGIRPNHLTVAAIPLLFILLAETGFAAETGYQHNLRRAWLLPPFMLVWANLHGGFLLGIAMLLLYVVSETVTLRHARRPLRPLLRLWGVVAATVVASLLTPNGILTYSQYLGFQGGVIQQKTSEYLSPLLLVKTGALIYWPYFIVLLMVLALLIYRRFQLPLTRTLLLLVMALLSLTAFRYAPLFVGAASVLLLADLEGIAATKSRRLWFAGASAVLVAALVLPAVSDSSQRLLALSKGPVDSSRLPVKAADFLEQHRLGGVAFTHFGWGGYLLWRQPGVLVPFVDGRSLNLPLFHAYTRVLWLPQETQSILDRHRVELIIMPRLNAFTGELYPLTDFLARSQHWVQVYHDDTATIYLRSGWRPDVERQFVLDKDLIYRDVLRDVARLRAASGANANLDRAAQQATMRLGSQTERPGGRF